MIKPKFAIGYYVQFEGETYKIGNSFLSEAGTTYRYHLIPWDMNANKEIKRSMDFGSAHECDLIAL